MIVLITGLVFSLAALYVALTLQFRLPLWLFFCGLERQGVDRLARFDQHRLRRVLSVLMYLLSFSLGCLSVLFYLGVIPETILLPLVFLSVLAVFNGVYFAYRRFDGNTYSGSALRSGRAFLAAVDVVLVALAFLYLW